MGEQSYLRSVRAYAPAWLTLLAGFAISSTASWWFWQEAKQVDQLRFQTAVTNVIEHLDMHTERYAEQLARIRDLIGSQAQVSEVEWGEYLTRLGPVGNLPALLELAYATNVNLRTRADLEREIAYLGQNASGKPVLPPIPDPPPLKIAYHWQHFSQITGEETEAWLRIRAISERWYSIKKGRLYASQRRLVTGSTGEQLAAVALFLPVFTTDLIELRKVVSDDHLPVHRFQGTVIATMSWEALVNSALPGGNGLVSVEAFADAKDVSEITAKRWMSVGVQSASHILNSAFAPRFRHTQSWAFYRARWQLVFDSTKLFDRQSTRYRAWVALGGGVVLSLLMTGLLAVQVLARRNQETISSHLRAALLELDGARKERERLGYDLHDGAIQSLYAFQLGLSGAADQANAAMPALGKRLSNIRRNVTSVIGELRAFVVRHEAGSGPAGDLVSVLTALTERWRSSTKASICTELSAEAGRRLSGEQSVHLANLAREALSNALRHADASQITVVLREKSDAVVLEIRDDGCGFDPEALPDTGVGLSSMASRARYAGGKLDITSKPGQGTFVSAIIQVPITSPIIDA